MKILLTGYDLKRILEEKFGKAEFEMMIWESDDTFKKRTGERRASFEGAIGTKVIIFGEEISVSSEITSYKEFKK